MVLVRGAKWDTYDFVYKIDFCVDKSGFWTTKMISNYHQLASYFCHDKSQSWRQNSLLYTEIPFVMTKIISVNKFHFCTQN
jgi:hypothetical protein